MKMVELKHCVRLCSVIGVALYASNLFVFLRDDQWKVYVKPLRDALSNVNLSDLNLSRNTLVRMLEESDRKHAKVKSTLDNADTRAKSSRTNMIVNATGPIDRSDGTAVENVNSKNKMDIIEKVEHRSITDAPNRIAQNKNQNRLDNKTDNRNNTIGDAKALNLNDNLQVRQSGMEHVNTSVTALSQHQQYQAYMTRLIRQQVLRRKVRLANVAKTPIVHIGFIKVHKALSTILQTMLFRFGYQRNLTFVLPAKGHYFSKSTASHEKLQATPRGRPYDILCNHGYFNFSLYSSVLPRDSVYIGIVRDPFHQFIASYNYYATQFHFSYLTNIPSDPITNLILYPEVYEESWPLSYTMNSMAKDFGFQEHHYRNYKPGSSGSSAHAYLEDLDAIFDLVLVSEWLDESLILMRRLLRWSMKDILYIKKTTQNHPQVRHINTEIMDIFKDRNRLDYLLYDYFLANFRKKMAQAGKSLEEETEHFKRTVIKVTAWCEEQYFGEYVVEETNWNKRFVITSEDCVLLLKSEMEFINDIRSGR